MTASSSRSAEVVMVGGGPAGLSCARALKRAGIHDITILEREAEAGGIPRHCGHTGYGWHEYTRLMQGPTYARRLAEAFRNFDLLTRTPAPPGGPNVSR